MANNNNNPMNNKALKYLQTNLSNIFPNIISKMNSFYIYTINISSTKSRSSLPLPFSHSSLATSEASRVYDVLQNMLEHILLNLHNIQKNLQFWQSRAEGSDTQKACFMLFERGPCAFADGTIQLIKQCIADGTGMKCLCQSASAYISERITVLTSLRYLLASFLAQVYVEIDKFGEDLARDPEKSLPLLLLAIDKFFGKLEASIGQLHATLQSESSIAENSILPLIFEKLPEVNQEGSQWTDCEIIDAVNSMNQNLGKLDSYLSDLVAKHQKPRKVTLYWLHYTGGVIGLSICSLWLVNHSRLMGSPDIDNWIREAKDSIAYFWNDHVEQPLRAIRDELFETFRKRHKGVMELEEVQLTSNSLHRMLLTFSEQSTKGKKFPEDTSDQEMMEIVMARYEKELMHPIQNLVGGEIIRALLIQIQKLKLDIETAMLELDQILRANEINFAVLAALPAFFISVLLLALVRAWFKKNTRAEGRGRIATLQRRLLLVEVEKKIIHFQICMDKGLDKEGECSFGLMLYSLDRLFRAVERHAKETGEWPSLRQDIIDLAKPGLQTSYKLIITSRMERMYGCLLPPLKN